MSLIAPSTSLVAYRETLNNSEFKEFFEGSQMTDLKSGEPSLWFHGTNREFDDFTHPSDLKGPGNFDQEQDKHGVYFGNSLKFVEQYADPLGANFSGYLGVMIKDLPDSKKTWFNAQIIWNRMVGSFVSNNGEFLIESEGKTILPGELHEMRANGDIGHYSSIVKEDGSSFALTEEFLRIFGGKLPSEGEPIVPYRSLDIDTQVLIQRTGLELLVPQRAKPRIIPAFIHAEHVHKEKVDAAYIHSMDEAFRSGVRAKEIEPSIDCVLVEAGIEKNFLDKAALVFDIEDIFVPNQSS